MNRSEKGTPFEVGRKRVLPQSVGRKTMGAVSTVEYINLGRSDIRSANDRLMTDLESFIRVVDGIDSNIRLIAEKFGLEVSQ